MKSPARFAPCGAFSCPKCEAEFNRYTCTSGLASEDTRTGDINSRSETPRKTPHTPNLESSPSLQALPLSKDAHDVCHTAPVDDFSADAPQFQRPSRMPELATGPSPTRNHYPAKPDRPMGRRLSPPRPFIDCRRTLRPITLATKRLAPVLQLAIDCRAFAHSLWHSGAPRRPYRPGQAS